jgi:hypothetical protein
MGESLRPWQIAVKLLPSKKGPPVSVETASDEDFQRFITSAGVPIDDSGIAEWSFDDRVGVIRHAIKHGLTLPFVEPKKNSSESEENPKKNTSDKSPEVAIEDGSDDNPFMETEHDHEDQPEEKIYPVLIEGEENASIIGYVDFSDDDYSDEDEDER